MICSARSPSSQLSARCRLQYSLQERKYCDAVATYCSNTSRATRATCFEKDSFARASEKCGLIVDLFCYSEKLGYFTNAQQPRCAQQKRRFTMPLVHRKIIDDWMAV